MKKLMMALGACVCALGAWANTYYVTPDGTGDGSDWANAFGSLQAALAAATEEGDEIRVKQGDYTMTAETTIASHPGLTIRGGYTGDGETREGRSNFLRDAASTDYFRLFSVTGSTVAFDGIGFLNGKFSGAVKGILGLGVCLQTSCNATFTNCLFKNNGVYNINNYGGGNPSYGGALYTDGGSLTIADCDFDGNYINTASGCNQNGWGGALYAKSTVLSVARTRFAKNINNTQHNRKSVGGAVALDSCNSALFDSCRFETNSVFRGGYNSGFSDMPAGGAVYTYSCSDVTIRDSTAIGGHVSNAYFPAGAQSCLGSGMIFYFENSSAAIVRTVLYNRGYSDPNKTSADRSYASLVDFRCEDTKSGTLSLTNVLMVAGNYGWCLGCCGEKAVIDAVNCTLTGVQKGKDAARTYTAYTQYSGTATFRNCLFWDNADGATYKLTGAEPTLVGCTTDIDPLWGDTTYCHPQSAAGRYDGGWFTGGEWVTTDETTSPTIDAGDATMSAGSEPQPNAHRVNVGYDAGSEVASKSVLGSDPVVSPDVLKVFSYPTITIFEDGATVKGEVASTGGGANPTVTVVWDTADRGTTKGSWANSEELGAFATWDLAAYTITGASGEVFYRFLATNEKGTAWSDPVRSFVTAKKPTAAYATPSVQHVLRTCARVCATMTDDGGSEATARVVWYPTDDPTDVRTNACQGGAVLSVGAASVDLTGLASGTSYTCRFEFTNGAGTLALAEQVFSTKSATEPICLCVGPAPAGTDDGSSWANVVDLATALDCAMSCPGDEIRLLTGEYEVAASVVLDKCTNVVFRGGYAGEGDARDGRSVLYRNTLGLEFRLFEVTASTVTFDGIGFKDGTLNTSGALGQAVRLQSSCTAVFTNCLFKNSGYNGNNSNADAYGGAIYTDGGALTVAGCDYEDNHIGPSSDNGQNVKGWGGAIYATATTVSICDSRFNKNYTGTAHNRLLGGGALALISCPTVLIDGCVFDGNFTRRNLYTPSFTDTAFGGSAYMKSCPSVIVRNCILKNGYTQNSSLAAADLAYAGCGHEFYLYDCTAEISRTVFYSRGLPAKNGYSGLVDVRDTALAMTNVLLVAGDQGWCLGTHGASTVDAVNCTFTGVKQPDAATRPGTAFAQSAGSATFRNCIFWDNFGGAWAKYAGNDPTLVDCMTATDPEWGDEVFCHPVSQAGRYDGGWFTNGTWVATDTATSPAVDRIPGFAKLATEPQPNGGHVNAGYDGNSEVASKSVLGTNPVVTEGTLAVYSYPDTQESPDGVTVYGDVAALSAGETAADVWLVYDSEDRGTSAKEDWAHVVPCGSYEPWALVTADISSFVGKVYYRFVAQDGQATAWGDPVREFVRAARPTVAYDTDAHPFTHVYRTSARVHFELVSDGGAAATAWATVAPTADPSAAVDFPVGEGTLAAGKYAAVMTGLNPGTEYTVTVTVRNSVGDAVTEPKVFTTPAVETKMSVCVAPTAAGYGDGTGWANATTLTDAITAVALGSGDEILLQSGTYAMFGFVLNQMTNLTVRGGYDASGTPYAGETVLTTEGLLTPTTDKRFFIAHHSKVTLDNLTFTKGTNLDGSDLFGQALGVKDSSDVTVTNCVFRQNGLDSATGFEFTSFYGGAIAVSGGRLTVADSTFSGNRLMGGGQNMQPYGGAISATGNAVVSVTGCTFDQNHVQMVHARAGGGGALFFGSGVQATVESCLFTTNYVRTDSGNNIYWPQEHYGPYGGSIYASSATLRLKDLRIVGGWAANGHSKELGLEWGGTFYFTGGTVSGENIAIYDAGGTGLPDTCAASQVATGSIAVNGGTVALTNVLHAGSRHGACVAHRDGTLELVNCTFVDAKGLSNSPVCGYLQYTSATSGSATMKNCIFWNNQGGFRNLVNDKITLDVSYSDIEGEADAAKHVISADPLLYAPTKARAYHLRAGSPCAGTGDATGWPVGATDLDGKPRTRGSTIDMGCYSYNVPGFMLMLK